jgi:hypothetical protein
MRLISAWVLSSYPHHRHHHHIINITLICSIFFFFISLISGDCLWFAAVFRPPNGEALERRRFCVARCGCTPSELGGQ